MIQFQENNHTDGRMEGWGDLISQDSSSYGWGQSRTNTTSADWHLKVKDIEQDVGLTKNYCIKVSMQKISSIDKHF